MREALVTSPERSHSTQRNRPTAPRWLVIILSLFVGLIVIPIAHGFVPWAISTWMPRHGWHNGLPGIWNWLGLIPVSIAVVLLIWILAAAIPQTPTHVEVGLTPQVLLTHGPYRLSRNPLYVAELGSWLGLAFFFGSLGILIGFVALLSLVRFVLVPREERTLEAAFGQSYLDYQVRTPRWFGRWKMWLAYLGRCCMQSFF